MPPVSFQMSRDIALLAPGMRAALETAKEYWASKNVDILVYCTVRSEEAQARLWRRGRLWAEIKAGADTLEHSYRRPDLADLLLRVGPQYEPDVVTWALPGMSAHQYGLAFDGVPMREGACVWGHTTREDKALWDVYGEGLHEAGLRWGYDWGPDRPHAEWPGFSAAHAVMGDPAPS